MYTHMIWTEQAVTYTANTYVFHHINITIYNTCEYVHTKNIRHIIYTHVYIYITLCYI